MHRKYDWVDPEIGHMAKTSVEGGTQFRYLHIISDNLARKYLYDLSDERSTGVIHRRRLIEEVQDGLALFFEQWTPK